MTRRWLIGISCGLALAQSAGAAELRCSQWQGLDDGHKEVRLEQRIGEIEQSPEMRQFRIDRDAVRRCLENQSDRIKVSLDDTCGYGLEAGIDALEHVLRDYVAACISRAASAPL